MKELKINNKQILAIQVSEEYNNFKISETHYLCGAEDTTYQAILPRLGDNYKIIGLLKNLNDKELENYVEQIHIELAPSPHNDWSGGFDYGYVDYNNIGEFAGYNGDAGAFRKPKDSFLSLLESNGLDTTKNLLILERETLK